MLVSPPREIPLNFYFQFYAKLALNNFYNNAGINSFSLYNCTPFRLQHDTSLSLKTVTPITPLPKILQQRQVICSALAGGLLLTQPHTLRPYGLSNIPNSNGKRLAKNFTCNCTICKLILIVDVYMYWGISWEK